MSPVIGVDFGTTNSVVAMVQPDGRVATARVAVSGAALEVFRSVLCFWAERGGFRHAAGPQAIEAYLDDPLASRLIMSMKILPGAAQLQRDPDLRPQLHPGGADRRCCWASCSAARASRRPGRG